PATCSATTLRLSKIGSLACTCAAHRPAVSHSCHNNLLIALPCTVRAMASLFSIPGGRETAPFRRDRADSGRCLSQRLLQQLVHDPRIGLALHRLHRLPDEETE